jgi:hypothetical protein
VSCAGRSSQTAMPQFQKRKGQLPVVNAIDSTMIVLAVAKIESRTCSFSNSTGLNTNKFQLAGM